MVAQIFDRNQLGRTEIDGRGDQAVAMHNLVDAQHAVVDEAEAAGLGAVAPDSDGGGATVYRFDDLTAKRRRGLFAASEPGAMGSVDIVEAGDVGFQATFRPILWQNISETSFSQP